MEQGENAPPMHVRCRSTIVAYDGEPTGKRSARDSEGKRIKIPADVSYREWMRGLHNAANRDIINNKSQATGDEIVWQPRNKANVLSKSEYSALRDLAEGNDIALSGVKKFDGSPATVRDLIDAATILKAEFPNVSDSRYKLTLAMSDTMHAEDFAVTIGRIITFNANAYRNVDRLAAEYQKLVAEGWFVKGTDYRAIIYHEFGHVVSDIYKLDPMEIACEITGLSSFDTLKKMSDLLSAYAGEIKDGGEIIAEVFADMSTGNPSEFSHKFYAKVFELTRR